MRIEKIKVYDFDELASDIQAQVIEHWRDEQDFFWADDWVCSLKEFFNYLSGVVSLKDWEWSGFYGGYVKFEIHHQCQELKGVRLWKYLQNNYECLIKELDYCPLSGYCGDYDILKPIADFIAKPNQSTNFEGLINECFESWAKGIQADYEHWLSEEAIKEDIEIGGYVFTDNGRIYN